MIGVFHDAINFIGYYHLVKVNYSYSQEFCKAFGEQVRKQRLLKGIPMRKFALQIDMEYSQLSKIERGVSNPTISTVKVLADGLNLSPMELFDFKVTGKTKK